MFFPLAMLGIIALEQGGIGESSEVIIAVDGQRTRDVMDFEELIGKVEAGEIVYLSVVSGGQRRQVAVELPGQ
jgi:S1-C subfamily serine protease